MLKYFLEKSFGIAVEFMSNLCRQIAPKKAFEQPCLLLLLASNVAEPFKMGNSPVDWVDPHDTVAHSNPIRR